MVITYPYSTYKLISAIIDTSERGLVTPYDVRSLGQHCSRYWHVRRQAITKANAEPSGTNFGEIWINIHIFLSTEIFEIVVCKIDGLFCSGLGVSKLLTSTLSDTLADPQPFLSYHCPWSNECHFVNCIWVKFNSNLFLDVQWFITWTIVRGTSFNWSRPNSRQAIDWRND